MKPSLSIIIPTLNEENYIQKTISNIFRMADNSYGIEVIVVDGGSKDATLDRITEEPVRVFHKPGFVGKKYESLNFGIHHSSSDVLVFLDADTLLPKEFDTIILQELADEKIVGGAFEFSFEHPDWKLNLLARLNRIRYRLSGMYYGDQAVFCKKSAILNIGGYPKRALMESAYLCKALSKHGKLSLIKNPIRTSPRRFNEHGFFKVLWFDFNMWVRFGLNLPVEKFGEKYWSVNLQSDE